jgi:hypothetical protein
VGRAPGADRGPQSIPVSGREVAGYGVGEVAGAWRLVRTGGHNGAARFTLHIRFIPTSHLKDFFQCVSDPDPSPHGCALSGFPGSVTVLEIRIRIQEQRN